MTREMGETRAFFVGKETRKPMLQPEMEAREPLIEIYVNTEDEAANAEVEQLLETLDIEQAVRRTLQAVHVEQPVTLTLVISSDAEIQTLNNQYRQQDKPTDVLSFPLLDEPLVEAPAEWLWQGPEEQDEESEARAEEARPAFVTPDELALNLGDIMISWPTVQRQAREAGHEVAYELLFLLCHGVLHLVGYDDQTEAGYTEMVRLQKAILSEREG
jgi:probable rRNA maturation factor